MIMTNKAIYYQNGRLFDFKSNSIKMNYKNIKEYNLIPILKMNSNINSIDYANSSIYITENHTLNDIFWDITNPIIRSLELLLCQASLKRCLDNIDLDVIDYAVGLDSLIVDGVISKNEYDERICQLLNVDKYNRFEFYKMYEAISIMSDSVFRGIQHAQRRLIDITASQSRIIKNSKKIEPGIDMRNVSPDADNIGWCTEDIFKTLQSSLELSTKSYEYAQKCLISKNSTNLRKVVLKIESGYFKNIKKHFPLTQNHIIQARVEKLYNDVKLIAIIRHQLTHNSKISSYRNVVFSGRRTPCINNIDLHYCDLPFWDITSENEIERSNNRIGFRSKHNDSVAIIRKCVIDTFELANLLIICILFECINHLKTEKVDNICVPIIDNNGKLLSYEEKDTLTFENEMYELVNSLLIRIDSE